MHERTVEVDEKEFIRDGLKQPDRVLSADKQFFSMNPISNE